MIVGELALPPWLLGLGGVFAVLGILGSSYAVLRSSISSKTTDLWKQQAEAFEERLEQIESDYKRCMEGNHVLQSENSGLKARIHTLESMVTAGPAIEALRKDMAAYHNELLGLLPKGTSRVRQK